MIEREKLLLLAGIERLKAEYRNNQTLDIYNRLQNLYACLVILNWKEVNRRAKR